MDTEIEMLDYSDFDSFFPKYCRLVSELAAAPADTVVSGRLAATLGLRPGTRLCRLVSDPASGPAPGIDGGGVLPAPDLDDPDDLNKVPVWVALLASENDWVRSDATEQLSRWMMSTGLNPTFEKSKDSVAELLRAVRRSRMPTRARHAALELLAEVGWHELEPPDRALVERLVRLKLLRAEVPAPMEHLEGSWYALPTGDQAAVLDAFGLCDPVPVPTRTGLSAFEAKRWDMNSWQVFVTPVLDGWTLVISDHGLFDESEDDARRRCAELSRRFGVAHWYAESVATGCADYSTWCVAEAGTVVAHCFYDHSGQGARTGPMPTIDELRAWVAEHDPGTGHAPPPPPSPLELWKEAKVREKRLMAFLSDDAPDEEPFDEEPTDEDLARYAEESVPEWELEVREVAWRLSVSPYTIGPHTRVEGRGALAVCAGDRHRRRGALL